MGHAQEKLMTVEAELRVPVATAQVVRFQFAEPVAGSLREDTYRLDMCLTPRPRNAQARYSDRWAPHRFERIGDLFLVPPSETLQARSDCGRQVSIVCQLHPDALRAWFEDDLKWTERRLTASLDIPDANIRGLLFRLAEEARHPGLASQVLAELIAAQMAIEISRYYAAIKDTPTIGGLAAWRLRLIDERLRELREPPTLAELAQLCRLSVRQLTRGFRVSRGSSIGDRVVHSRLEHAKRLLSDDQSVKAVAYTLGFSSPSSFSYAFRQIAGETPREFRQRMLPGERTAPDRRSS
jgi:AraC family transcriptional regulator